MSFFSTFFTNTRAFLKKYVWYVLPCSVASIALLLYFFRLPFANIPALDAIPMSVAMLVEIPKIGDVEQQLDSTAYKSVLSSLTLVEKSVSDLNNLKKLFDKMLISEDTRLLMGAEASNTQTIDFIYVIDTKWRKIHLKSLLENQHGITIRTHNFQGHEVFNVNLWNNFAFSFASYRNLIIGARYSTLVEDALIAATAKTGVNTSRKFGKLNDELTNKYDMSVYFNMEALPQNLASFLTPEKKQTLTTLSKSIAWVGNGLTFSKEGIAITGGVSLTTDNALTYALKEDNYRDRSAIASVLPANTAMMLWLGVGDFNKFHNRTGGEYLFSHFMSSWIGEDLAYVISEPHSSDASAGEYALFKIKDKQRARERMTELENKEGLLENYDYNTFKIKQLASKGLLKGLVSGLLDELHQPYYAFTGDYIVFCSSRAGLEVFIDKYIVGHTLSNDLAYQEFTQKQTDKSNLFYYVNSSYLGEMVQSAVQDTVKAQLLNEYDELSKMNLLGLNLHARSGGFTYKGNWKWNNGKKKSKAAVASVAWKTVLDAEAVTAPVVVENPKSQESFIFIQDAENQIYIINSAGAIVKKRKIDGKILSTVKQIAFSGEEKLYYAFNTENKVYILDENGVDIQNFPMLLQSPAASGMLVIDFDNSKQYQYFVPAKNGNIYGFERSGKPIAGWNPRMSVGVVKVPMQHFQTEGKDFIVAVNESNQIVVLRRNGALRFSVSAEGKVISPAGFQATSPQRIVVMNANGTVQNINFAGETFKLTCKAGKGANQKFIYTDVIGDSKNEYITLNNNLLTVFGYEGEQFGKLFEFPFQDTIDEVFPVAFPNKSKKYIGLMCKASAHIFLIDGKGKMYKEFPLGGSTSFQIGNFFGEDVSTLVVANGASVYTYKLK